MPTLARRSRCSRMERPEKGTLSRAVRHERKRTCNLCGGSFTAPAQHDDRRHNCLSICGAVVGELPHECWQNLDHPYAHDLLAAVPSYLQRSMRTEASHRRRQALTVRVLALTRDGRLTMEQVEDLYREFRPSAVHRLVERLPAQSEVRAEFVNVLERLRLRDEAIAQAKKEQRAQQAIKLPDDFERGVNMFIEKTHRIADIKHRHGHRYSPNTVRKRGHDARAFCEFLAGKGLQQWPQVAQHHLDDYLSATDRWAAARAYTFLQFIRQNFRLTQRFVRPKMRLKAPAEAVMPIAEIPAVLKRLIGFSDRQAVVAGLFLALFAQTPTRSAELTFGNFRKRDGKIEALFAEQWTPLDPLTARHLAQLAPGIVDDDAVSNTRLFRYSAAYLGRKVGQAVEVPLRPLRLGAVANLIRSGITDRGALHRVLGVSLPTLAYVEKLFEWDLHMTVDPEMLKSRNELIRGERTE